MANTQPMQFDPNEAFILAACGYTCTHYPARWQDVGDVENGPSLSGHPDTDVWTLKLSDDAEHEIAIVNDEVVSIEVVPVFPDDYPF